MGKSHLRINGFAELACRQLLKYPNHLGTRNKFCVPALKPEPQKKEPSIPMRRNSIQSVTPKNNLLLWLALGGVFLLCSVGLALYFYLKPAPLVVASPQEAAAAVAAYLREPPPSIDFESELGGQQSSTLGSNSPTPNSDQTTDEDVIKPQAMTPPSPQETFRCEKKKRCPQMSSCQEAMYYLTHCPWPMMDGDGDGIPCEDQWCGH